MSDLTYNEKYRLEKLLEMGSGYVLDFNNRTFQEFVFETTGKNIFDEKYNRASGSKANRLRAFWHKESNHITGKLLTALVDYHKARRGPSELQLKCEGIALRLTQNLSVQDIGAIEPNAEGKEFEALAESVKRSINDNKPEHGLDRLHTFAVKYMRILCEKHSIQTNRDKPLHSLFGEYVKALRKAGLVKSDMSERILKSSLSILEAFNQVRNEYSLAHPNPMLTYDESLLIFNNVASSIRFIAAIEASRPDVSTGLQKIQDEDIPF